MGPCNTCGSLYESYTHALGSKEIIQRFTEKGESSFLTVLMLFGCKINLQPTEVAEVSMKSNRQYMARFGYYLYQFAFQWLAKSLD